MDKTTPMKAKPLVDVTCKLGVKGCFEDGRCHALGNCENKIKTNADKIRAMSDEELEEFIDKVSGTCLVDALGGKSECNTECRMCKIKFGSILDWLQSEAE